MKKVDFGELFHKKQIAKTAFNLKGCLGDDGVWRNNNRVMAELEPVISQ
ncbi:MAG: hypothetical protein K5787_07245 [Lentisphaeria bacterium]|nr:hypothetical protein [Lentisphaeria bacterium]